MKKRSLTLFGHRTSISLEEPFWMALLEIADQKEKSIQKLVEEIDELPLDYNLSCKIRVYILEFYRVHPE